MLKRKISLSIAAALLTLALAGSAYAVWTGNLNLSYEDPNDKRPPVTFTYTISTEEATSIEANWKAGLGIGETYNWGNYLTNKIDYRIDLDKKWDSAITNPETRFQIPGENYVYLRNLGRFYRMEMQSPETQYYNQVDERYGGHITKAEFDQRVNYFRSTYGAGSWPWNYTGDYDPFYDDYSSLCNPPHYLTGGIQKYYYIPGTDTALTVYRQIPVARVTFRYENDAYAQRGSLPLHEYENYLPVASWNIPRYVYSGPAVNTDIIQDPAAWKTLYKFNIGTDLSIGTGLYFKVGYEPSDYSYSSRGGDYTYTFVKDPVLKAAVTPNDPLYASSGSWKQSYADQWALKRIGFKPMEDPTSAWNLTTGTERPVVVAVIDSGIDLTHPDLHINNIWVNEKETAGNRRDDDDNGYVDDLIGWNFVQNNNNPSDFVGHGTHVAGLIAARWNNGRGIAGINRGARIMVLKALNESGKGWGSDFARAIVYAVDNGAKIINISAEHTGQTKFLERAFAYAEKKGALVVVSAGNEAADTLGVEPANQPGVLVVAATLPNDKRAGFSNYGERVHLAAPGVDVLSLRAAGTDLVHKVATDPSKNKPGEAVVGKDLKYYRASGTSFAAPLVTGVASLMLAKNPALTAEQIKRMLMMSADDIEDPGWDLATGYGLVNARKALEADPDYYLYAELHRIAPARDGNRTVIQVFGTVGASQWGDYRVEVGLGENPANWRPVGRLAGGQIKENLLATLTPQDFGGTGSWSVRVVAQDRQGRTRESRQTLNLQ